MSRVEPTRKSVKKQGPELKPVNLRLEIQITASGFVKVYCVADTRFWVLQHFEKRNSMQIRLVHFWNENILRCCKRYARLYFGKDAFKDPRQ